MLSVKHRRRLLATTAVTGVICNLLCVVSASAQSPTYSFNINPEPLSAALRQFAQVSGQQVIFTQDLVAGKTAPRLIGRYTADDALAKLIAGAGLDAERGPAGVVMVRAKNASGGDSSASSREAIPSSQDAAIQEVQVTGTRVTRKGFVAPTPETTVTSQDLQIAGYTEIGQALADLPGYRADYSPTTESRALNYQSMNVADLRGLGEQRTLALIDGERPVWESSVGFDLNSIPISLVKRVDVVTGGASAAYGSDAVSGVINVVLDNNFQGTKANIQYGQDGGGYGPAGFASLAFGTKFGPDDRGHFMVAGQFTDNGEIKAGKVPQLYDNGFIQNPAYVAGNGQPQYILAKGLNYSNASLGGLITSGPLKGTAFGAGGVPYAFQTGAAANSTYMVGGDGESVAAPVNPQAAAVDSAQRYNAYARMSYDFASFFNVRADFLYSGTKAVGDYGPPTTNSIGAFSILNTNAYLPASVASTLAADKSSSFTLGRVNSDFGDATGYVNDQTYWGSLGASGDLGGSWKYSLFYNYGSTDFQNTYGPQQITTLLKESVNSIKTANGPVCASTALTNPLTGATCVPIDLFGDGAPSQAALNFFTAYSHKVLILDQNEGGGQIQGEPFSTWAGPVSVVAGAEWRTESLKQTNDALSAEKALDLNNASAFAGHYAVTEGFAEIVVPLVKNQFAARELDLNAAARESDYSRSGDVTSWKFGVTDTATSEFLIRGTYSQDVRAPNLSELYTIQSHNTQTIVDPQEGGATYVISSYAGGNPHLLPEMARTMTYGGVYKPQWLPRLQLSIDWYSINIHNAITTASAQTEVNYCYEGVQADCADVVRGSNGLISYVNTESLNLQKLLESGLDVEATHQIDLSNIWRPLGGTLSSHLIVNYVDKLQSNDGRVITNLLGNLENPLSIPASALRWRATLTEGYNWRQFDGYVRLRFLSGGYYEPASVYTDNDNHVDSQYYFDVGGSYYLTEDRRYQAYINIVNILDRPPPVIAVPTFYDTFGMMFNAGFRAVF